MTNPLHTFIHRYRSPRSAIEVAGDTECREWAFTEHGWNPCGVRVLLEDVVCPNENNHGKPEHIRKKLDNIAPGDRVCFDADPEPQWGTVLEWYVYQIDDNGNGTEWQAVIHVEHTLLSDGTYGPQVVHRKFQGIIDRAFTYAYTPGVFKPPRG